MLTIDMRMIDHSGIGTYLANLVPPVVSMLPEMPVCVLGNRERLQPLLTSLDRPVRIESVRSPIYSLQEQWELWRKIPVETTLFWSPHFNIPVLYSGKLLVTVHDVFHMAMSRLIGRAHKRMYAKFMFQAVRRKADRIISVSQFTKREFHKWVGEGSKPISTVYNGIDRSWFAIEKQGAPQESPYFLFVGNVKPNKNVSRLIRAFNRIKNQVPHKLVIVGKKDGFITEDPQVWQGLNKLGDRVVFTGYVDDAALRQYYAHATALVFPSLYEGFGFPPLEAMAAGTPVLSSRAASLPEVCGEAALYFNPEDDFEIATKMLRLVRNDALRNELSDKGRRQALKYSWQTCSAQTVTVIREEAGA